MLYGENTGPTFHHSLCPVFCIRRTDLTSEGIINFYVLIILYFRVHVIKNAYFALLLSWLQQFVRLCYILCNLVT